MTRTLRACVAAAIAAHVLLVILAPFIARYGLIHPAPPQRLAFLDAVGGFLGLTLTGPSLLDQRSLRAFAYLAPLALATGAFVIAMLALHRARDVADPRPARILWGGIIAIAAVEILRLPVMTIDFWLSIAWGRMAADGVSPYYHPAPLETLRDLPLEAVETHMTYGPLWAALAAAIAMIGGPTVVSVALHKLVLAAAWIGTAAFAQRLGARVSPWHGTWALAIAGLLPAGSLYTVGDGHNDALLACGAAGFLYYLACERRLGAGAWLSIATLAKYVALPLGLLAVADLIGRPARDWERAALVAAACAVFAVLVCLPFVHDLSFLNETARMRGWRFLTPADAVRSAASLVGIAIPRWPLAAAFLIAFAAIALLALRRYLRERTPPALASAALAIMAVILFCVVGHVWPWFVVWLIPLAACAYRDSLTAFVLSFAVAAPLLDLGWLLRDDAKLLPWLGLIVYALALVGLLLWRRRALAANARRDGGRAP